MYGKIFIATAIIDVSIAKPVMSPYMASTEFMDQQSWITCSTLQ